MSIFSHDTKNAKFYQINYQKKTTKFLVQAAVPIKIKIPTHHQVTFVRILFFGIGCNENTDN